VGVKFAIGRHWYRKMGVEKGGIVTARKAALGLIALEEMG
jgi:hypothetical protein